MMRRPPRPPPFPSTTLFGSAEAIAMPLDEAVLDYQVVGQATSAEGSPRLRVVVVAARQAMIRSEEHTSELQSQSNIVCRLLPGKKRGCHRAALEPLPALLST